MNINKIVCLAMVFVFVFLVFGTVTPVHAVGTTYYISSSTGNDNNNGTSSSTPWKTLAKASRAYVAGDQILLKCGDTWTDERLNVSGDGTSTNPIVLGSYGTGNKPALTRTSVGNGQICVDITNPSGWKIKDLKFDTGLFGVYLHWDGDYNNDYIWVENCEFYNFDGTDYTYGFPCGLWFKILNGVTDQTYCSNITVTNCWFQDCLNGVDVYAFTGGSSFLASYIAYRNVNIYNNIGNSCGSTPVGIANTTGGSEHDNLFFANGDHYNSVGTCSGFLMWVKDFSVYNNEWAYSKRVGSDVDGCAIDFEAKCDNVTFTNNFIHDTDGTALFFYNNGGVGGNTNIHITNNLFSNNGLNPPDATREIEICYGAGTHSANIDNNTFYLAPGVPAYDLSASGFTYSGNKQCENDDINYSTNLALNATATASSQWDANYAPDKANDNNMDTRWNSAYGTTSGWLQLDFAAPTTINKVVFEQETTWTTIDRYVVQTWDGTKWVDAFNGLTMAEHQNCPIRTVTTQKVRLWVLSTTGNTPTIKEFKVYNVNVPGGGPIALGNTYKLTNVNSGKVLGIRDNSTANDAAANQYDWLGNTSQQWVAEDAGSGYYKFRNVNSGRYLGIRYNSTANDARANQYDYLGNTSQQWQIVDLGGGLYRLVNRNSGRVLGITGNSTSNDADVNQYDWLGNYSQQWRFCRIQ